MKSYTKLFLFTTDTKSLKVNSVNPLYVIIKKPNGYFNEIKKNKYLTLVRINESKEMIKNMKKFRIK